MESYTNKDLEGLWEVFFSECGYLPKIKEVVKKWPEQRSLAIDYRDLERFRTDLIEDFAKYVQKDPRTTLEIGARVAAANTELGYIPLRLHGCGPNVSPDKIGAEYVGRLVTFDGLVETASNVWPRIVNAMYKCRRCGIIFHFKNEDPPEAKGLPRPIQCPPEQGGCGKGRYSTKFDLLREKSVYTDMQLAKVVERASRRGIICYLAGDLAGGLEPGQHVRITGIGSISVTGRDERLSYYITVNSIEPVGERMAASPQPVDIKPAIAPGLDGLDDVKTAIELQLFGGVPHGEYDYWARGDINILLLGEPGTGKTTLLKSAVALAPRGTYASAPTEKLEGLIGEIVDFRWGYSIRGGEITLNSEGLLAIDDIDVLPDVSAFNEPLEHQTVTVSGKGHRRRLAARCAVLAAANEEVFPKKFLDRFDYIAKIERPKRSRARRPKAQQIGRIRAYIAHARSIEPELTPGAAKVIETFDSYRHENTIRRFAEAAARRDLRKKVSPHDIAFAQKLIESSYAVKI